jgi:cobalamin biosynthesis Mg chelatase CobN
VLALLAFACFPVLAQAHETVYDPEPTNLPSEERAPTHHKNLEQGESSPQAHSSGTPGGGSPETGPGSSEKGASQESNPSTPGGGGQGQGKGGNGGANPQQAGGGIQSAKPVAHSTESSGDGSSSPLVPILIAVAILAAISIGAVLVRQRRGSDSGISPKAS